MFVAGDKTRIKDIKAIYIAVEKSFPNVSYQLIILEPLYFAGASAYASAEHIPFLSISDFKTQDAYHILRDLGGDVIVLGEDMAPPYRAFVEAARSLGTPTVLITCGIFGDMPFTLRNFVGIPRYLKSIPQLIRTYRFLYKTLIASGQAAHSAWWFMARDLTLRFLNWSAVGRSECDLICVSGEHYRQLMIAMGRDGNSVIVTGQPRFDEIQNKKRDPGNLRKNIGIENGHPIVSLLTDAMVEHGLWNERKRIEYFSKILDALFPANYCVSFKLVVKVHPFEDSSTYQNLVRMRGLPVIVSKDIDLHELINASRVVIIGTSTTGLETLLLGRRLIVARFYGEHEYVPYESGGVAGIARNPDELRHLVELALKQGFEYSAEEKRRIDQFLSDHVLSAREGAGFIVAKAVQDLYDERKANLQ